MRLGQEIEKIRREIGLNVVCMCNIFETDERGYYEIVSGKRKPTVFQLIMFIDTTHCPIEILLKK